MALTKLIPASPNTNLKAGVDMTPLKIGDYNNKIRPEIDTAITTSTPAGVAANTAAIAVNTLDIALKAPITDASLLGTIKMTALPAFGDDAAAGVGGLVAGTLYQSDGTSVNGPVDSTGVALAGVLMVKQ